jgi:general secretion pathway protein D
MKTPSSATRFFVLAILSGIMAGCATPSVIPPPLQLPARATPQATESGLAGVAAETKRSLVLENPSPPVAAGKPATPSTPKPAGGPADIVLNFDQLPLPAFIQAVYATALKRTISMDPAISARKDLVTLRGGKSLTASEAESVAGLLLKSYGVAVQDLGGLTRFVPDNSSTGYLSEIRRGRALPDTPMPMRPVFLLAELQSIRNNDVMGYLKTLFGEKIRFTEDPTRNSILMAGNGEDVQAALEAIQVLDQPMFKARNSIRISPSVWSADELAKRLTEILVQEGYAVGTTPGSGGIQFPITLLPVAGVNSVIVFAQSKEIIAHIVEWAKVLDKPAEKSTGRNFFSYQVRNTDATRLAETVQQLLSGSARPASTASGTTGTASATTGTAASPAVGGGGGVVVDKATNTILFRATSDDYADIVRLLRELDRTSKQVLIEVTVAQVAVDDSLTLGVDWIFRNLNNSGLNVTQLGGNTAGASTAFGGFTGFAITQLDRLGQPRAVLNALASDNKVTVLSNPSLIARNGESASIQVGQDVPILTSQQTNSSTGGSGIISSVQYRNTGTILKIKPVIHSSDQVDMEVNQEVSSVANNTTGGISSPTINKSSLDTKLTLKHGSTYVLGGLISNNVDKNRSGVPFLKDIPIIGQAFSKTVDSTKRNELVILITPYIISDDGEARAVTDAFRKQLGAWAQEQKPTLSEPATSAK